MMSPSSETADIDGNPSLGRRKTPFEDICDHVERNIIGFRADFQPYGVYFDGGWYAAPLHFIEEHGFTPERVWRPDPS